MLRPDGVPKTQGPFRDLLHGGYPRPVGVVITFPIAAVEMNEPSAYAGRK